MLGVGYRSEMKNWDISQLNVDFIEVAPENWIDRDTTRLREIGKPIAFHGVSLNLGGKDALDVPFIKAVSHLMNELDVKLYSDHLASTGHAGHLYDLFPVEKVKREVYRIAGRIQQVQDILGRRIAIENPTAYVDLGDIPDQHFLNEVAQLADCDILLDVNNIVVNFKNHGLVNPVEFVQGIPPEKISYIHVAGHYWNEELQFYIDSHSRSVDEQTLSLLRLTDKPILLEWDNSIPSLEVVKEELWKISSHTSVATVA